MGLKKVESWGTFFYRDIKVIIGSESASRHYLENIKAIDLLY